MKKIILYMVLILIVVWAAFSLVSSFSPGKDYAAEKLIYRAMKLNSVIARNPDVTPPRLLAAVEKDLLTLIKKYPDAAVTKTAAITLAEFYISNKKYGEAQSLIKSIMTEYKENAAVMSTAQFLKALTYERMGKWDKAFAEFIALRDRYPYTQLGMEAPLYIVKHYETKGETAAVDKAYADAAAFYEKMEKEHSGKRLGYAAALLLIQTNMNSKHYEAAGRAIEHTLNRYPGSMTFRRLLPYLEPIFIEKLKSPERVIAIYKNVMEKVRDPKLKKLLQRHIDKLSGKK
ncbi:MAG: hypothetical protein WC522_02380 [Candidatus Omnitrophota bacterium]